MEFMGIGPLELLVILLAGFLLLGPDRLPELAARAGRLLRSLRKTSSDFSRAVTEEMRAVAEPGDQKHAPQKPDSEVKANEP